MLHSVRSFERYGLIPADLGSVRRLFIGATAWKNYLQIWADMVWFTRSTVHWTPLLVKPKGEKLIELSVSALMPCKTALEGRMFSSLSDVGSLEGISPSSRVWCYPRRSHRGTVGEIVNFCSKSSACFFMKAPLFLCLFLNPLIFQGFGWNKI